MAVAIITNSIIIGKCFRININTTIEHDCLFGYY